MTITDLVPWRARRELVRRDEPFREPFNYLQQQINRMFDDTFALSRGLPEMAPVFAPPVEIVDANGELRITVEVPGIEAKDIDVNVTDDSISIRGQKRQEKTTEEPGEKWTERCYGAFERVIPLPVDVKTDKAKAAFKNGVLEVTLPKKEGAKPRAHHVKIE